jgi:hypothetical protein|tara:strand:- start:909 stop:1160 length:252 start_codon:yes stop_codon:yes gene_type:complete
MKSINNVKKATRRISRKIKDIDETLKGHYRGSSLSDDKLWELEKSRSILAEKLRLLEKVIPKIPKMTNEELAKITSELREYWI